MTMAIQTTPNPQEIPQIVHDPIASLLERVLMDPSIPIERLERLLEMQERERDRRALEEFSAAMAAAQKQMRAVLVDKSNSQTRSKYASYAALDALVRPVYTDHGFSVTYNTESVPDRHDIIRVVAYVSNKGYERRYEIEMPCDGKGAKGNDVMTRTHALKSAVSYAKSTLLPMIFNIAVTDRADDDGNAAGGASGGDDDDYERISAAQVSGLRSLMHDHGVNEEKFCAFAGIDRLELMSTTILEAAERNIRAKRKANA